MKKLVLAATVSLADTTAFAGGMGEPIMEPQMEPAIVETQTSSSSGGVVVALLLLLVIAAAASN